MSRYVYMHYHTFLKQCTKDNKMKKVTLKIDNMHFFSKFQTWVTEIKKEQQQAKENNGKLSKNGCKLAIYIYTFGMYWHFIM